MDVIYSLYTENDFDDLKSMVFGLYADDPTGLPITEEKIYRTARESIYHPEKVQIIILRSGSVSIGYSILTTLWSNEYGGNVMNIDELFIKNEYRNKKVASNYIKYIQESNQDVVLFELETTPANENAFLAFRKLGFEVSSNIHLIFSSDIRSGKHA